MSVRCDLTAEAVLPTVFEYITEVVPAEHREELWRWVGEIPSDQRQGAHVVDMEFPPGPGGFVGEEWVPVCKHRRWAVWIVRHRELASSQ